MSLRKDTVQLEIILKADEARKELVALDDEAVKLTKALKGMTAGTDEYAAANTRLEEIRTRMQQLRNEIGLTGMTMKELTDRQKQLNVQMRNLDPRSEEYKRLDEELRRVNARLGELRGGARETQSQMGQLGGVLSEVFNLKNIGIGLLMGAVAKFGESFVKTFTEIQATGDAFAVTVEGMKTGWEYFMRSLVSGDWSNFMTNLKAAVKAGKEYAAVMDDIADRNRAFTVNEGLARQQIAKLDIDMKNVALPYEKRADAAKEIIRLEEELSNKRADITDQEFKTEVNRQAKLAAMNENDLKFYIQAYDANKSIREEADKYLETRQTLKNLESQNDIIESAAASQGRAYTPDKRIGELKAQIAEATPALKEFAAVHEKYQLTTDEGLDKVTAAWRKNIDAVTDFSTNSATAQIRLSKLLKQIRNDSEASAKEAQAARDKARREQEKKEEARRKKALDKLEQDRNEAVLSEKERYVAGEVNYDNYVENLSAIDRQYYKDRAELEGDADKTGSSIRLKAVEEDVKKLEELDKQVRKNAEQTFKELDKLAEKEAVGKSEKRQAEYMAANKAFAEAEAALLLSFDRKLISEEEYQEKRIEIIEKYNRSVINLNRKFDKEDEDESAKAADGKKKKLENFAERYKSDDKKFGEDLQNLKDAHAAGLLSEQEYIGGLIGLWTGYLGKKAEIVLQAAEIGSNLVKSFEERDTAVMNAEYEARLTAAGNNAEERKIIEEERAREEIEIQKKYADANFALQVIQISVTGLMSAMQAFSAMSGIPVVGPVLGAAAAAAVAVMTVAQISKAKAERDRIKNISYNGSSSGSGPKAERVVVPTGSFSEGGYTGEGSRLEPAGIVHKGEYVVAQPEMVDPRVFDHVRAIDNIRHARTGYSSLPGYSDGGFVSSPSDRRPDAAPSAATDPLLQQTLARMNTLLDRLDKQGIKAETKFSFSEFDRGKTLYDESRKAGSR